MRGLKMPSGKVKWFNAKKGYGFITDDKTQKDILDQIRYQQGAWFKDRFTDSNYIDHGVIRKFNESSFIEDSFIHCFNK